MEEQLKPLKFQLKVAQFRYKNDAVVLKDEISKLETVLLKLISSDEADILAPRKHFFTYPFGERFSKTVFSYDEIDGTSQEITDEELNFKGSHSI